MDPDTAAPAGRIGTSPTFPIEPEIGHAHPDITGSRVSVGQYETRKRKGLLR